MKALDCCRAAPESCRGAPQAGSDLFALVRGEFQILCQMIEFLIDRPRAVNRQAFLIRPLLLRCMFLGHDKGRHPDREHAR